MVLPCSKWSGRGPGGPVMMLQARDGLMGVGGEGWEGGGGEDGLA